MEQEKPKPPNQILIRGVSNGAPWAICRGSDGRGYYYEEHLPGGRILKDAPMAFFPLEQEMVAEIFRSEGKEWRVE